MARNAVGRWTDENPPAADYQSVPRGRQDAYEPGLDTYGPGLHPHAAAASQTAKASRTAKKEPADGSQPKQRAAKSRLDEWMEVDFKFGGSRIKRKTIALVLLGAPAVIPLFFMLPALLTLNSNTFAVSVDDTLGTGGEICLFLCLLA